MQATKAVGRKAASRKYDLITALGVHALSGGTVQQRQALRFLTLLTARYNWISNELSIGRAEIARLWHVTERTVKRELAQFRGAGWLRVKRPSARGRVTVYAVDIERVLLDTASTWHVIGPDFVVRLRSDDAQQPDTPNVVPFPTTAAQPDVEGGRWAQVSAALAADDPQRHAAWYKRLSETEGQGGRVILQAPSDFVANYVRTHLMRHLYYAYARVDPSVRSIEIVCS